MNKKGVTGNVAAYIFLAIGMVVMIFPFLWMLSTSLKTGGATMSFPPKLIPDAVTFENYKTLFVKINFSRYTLNSLFIVTINVCATMVSASLAAFGLAMFEFKGRKLIYVLMLATLMMPYQVTMIPQFFVWKELGVYNTYIPLLAPAFLGSAFGIFLMHQNYKSLPKELYETSVIDGCNPISMIFKIYIPLSKPSLASLGVFTFIGSWNSTLEPLIYLKDNNLKTLTLALLNLTSDPIGVGWPVLMSGAMVTMLPAIIVFLFAQKYFIQGIASTGLKG